ncbi:MAG: hypothetical protein JNK72_10350 [Myxococcales bacterium]|nr:hypothetical protein [Myxococcales bacterium]
MSRYWQCVVLAAVVGCGPARGSSGGGGSSDAAADVAVTDQGVPLDRGQSNDLGPGLDAGALDATTPPIDTGNTPIDTGNTPVDTGNTPVDTGNTPVDAGCTPTGTENTATACSDGLDNDCDGFRDCMDFDCSRNPAITFCDAGTAPVDVVMREDVAGCVRSGDENSIAACNDGIDNDCDGYRDCNDRNCSCLGACGPAIAGCVCRGAENTNTTCSNAVDEDCNGFIDCSDFACTRSTAVSICPRDGGVDAGFAVDSGNDAGARDAATFRDAGPREDAAGCVRSGDENNLAQCNDGIDNDCDGFRDCADRNCSCVGACAPAVVGCTCRGPESTSTACSDAIDNDCNSFVDCADFACSRNNPNVTHCPAL